LLVKVKGDLVSISLEDLINFYPWFKNIVEELKKLEVNVEPFKAKGLAEVEIDCNRAVFEIEHVTPPPEEEWKPYYRLEIKVNDVAKIRVLNVDEAQVRLWWNNVELATINLSSKTIESLTDPFWDLRLSRGEIRFRDLRRIVKIVSYLRGKGFTLSKYAAETLAKIHEKMGAKSFEIRLKLTIIDQEKVPSYNELIKHISNILVDKGLAVEETRGTRLIEMFEKPLP